MAWVNGKLQPARPLTTVERELGRQAIRDQDAAIQAKIKQEDEIYDREQREKRVARETEQRARSETEVAAMRADVERDLRLGGAPTADIGRLADAAVSRYFEDRARTSLPPLEQTTNELRASRRRRNLGAL